MELHYPRLPSAAVLGPRSGALGDDGLSKIRSFLRKQLILEPFARIIRKLPGVWSILTDYNAGVAFLAHGPRVLQQIAHWTDTVNSGRILQSLSGIGACP